MQHIAFIYLNHSSELRCKQDINAYFADRLPLWNALIHEFDFRVSIFQRGLFNAQADLQDVNFQIVADGYEPVPQKLQRTDKLHQAVAAINPSVIQVQGLDLPLHFRWLRARLGEQPLLIGRHGGEYIWHNRKIWLQQLGLRSADAFLFQQKQEAHSWLKHAAILPCQPVFAPADGRTFDAEFLAKTYRNMLRWRHEKVA